MSVNISRIDTILEDSIHLQHSYYKYLIDRKLAFILLSRPSPTQLHLEP